MFLNTVFRSGMVMLAFCGLVSCSGGGGNPPPPPVPPTTYTVSGTVTGPVQSGVILAMGNLSSVTGANGTFTFANVANGTYTATALLTNFTFNPTSISVVVNGANVSGVNFVATAVSNPPTTYTVSGTVTGAVQSGVIIAMGNLSTVTNTNGNFTFTGVANGNYIVVPSLSGHTFSPTSVPAVVNGANINVQNFVAAAVAPETYIVSGTVTLNGTIGTLNGVTITMGNLSSVTGANGGFTFTGVANGSYTATASLTGYTFNPSSVNLTINGGNVANVNFVATAVVVDSRYSLNWIRVTPNAVFDNEFATTPITIEASASGTGFTLYATGGNAAMFDKTQPFAGVKALMQDTGILDSKNLGAHIYRATFAIGFTPRLRYYGKTVDSSSFNLEAYDSAGNYLSSVNQMIVNVSLGIVSKTLSVATSQVASDVFAASNMVNIVIPDFDLNQSETDATKKVYQYYPDVFDGCVIHSIGRTHGFNTPGGTPIKNATTGINVPITDSSASWGSNGVLSSIVFETPGDITDLAFLHEHGHSVAFYLNRPEFDLTNETRFHSSYIGQIGQMGGDYLLVEQSNGDFLLALPDIYNYQSRNYSHFEQYIMGLVPPSAVQPMRFVINASPNHIQGEIIPHSATTLVTIDDITRVYGERTPTSATSQKSFRTVFIGISERPMTSAEIALMNRIAIYYASDEVGGETDDIGVFPVRSMPPFKAATTGNGTMVTILPSRK